MSLLRNPETSAGQSNAPAQSLQPAQWPAPDHATPPDPPPHIQGSAKVITLAMLCITILCIAGFVSVQNRRIVRERDAALAATFEAQAALRLFCESLAQDDLLPIIYFSTNATTTTNPPPDSPYAAALLAALTHAKDNLDLSYPAQPAARATIQHAIGLLSLRLGDLAAAQRNLSDAFNQRLALRGNLHPDVGESLLALGLLASISGEHNNAAQQAAAALAIFRALPADPSAQTAQALTQLGQALHALGNNQEALVNLRQARDLRQFSSAPSHANTLRLASTLRAIAAVHLSLNDTAAALENFSNALALVREVAPASQYLLLRSLVDVGSVALTLQDTTTAITALEEANRTQQRLRGERHPDSPYLLRQLGRAYMLAKRPADAEQAFAGALLLLLRHPSALAGQANDLLACRSDLAAALIAQQDFTAAELVLTEALAPFAQPASWIAATRSLAPTAVDLYSRWQKLERLDHWRALLAPSLQPATPP